MEKLTTDERFVLYVMKTRKRVSYSHYSNYKQSIDKISKEIAMDKEELREILISLKEKGFVRTEPNSEGVLKWIVK